MQSYFMETRFMGKLLGTVKILKNRQNEIFEDWVTDCLLAADAKVIVVQHVKEKYKSLQYYNHSDVSSVCLGFAVDDLYITYIGIQSSSIWVVCRCIYSFSLQMYILLLFSPLSHPPVKSWAFLWDSRDFFVIIIFFVLFSVRKHLSHSLLFFSITIRATFFLVNQSLNPLSLGAEALSKTPIITTVISSCSFSYPTVGWMVLFLSKYTVKYNWWFALC